MKDILVILQQQETDLSTAGVQGAKWQGTVPYLCVIMCLTDDQVKRLFLDRANVRTRYELDGRNSENRRVLLLVRQAINLDQLLHTTIVPNHKNTLPDQKQ
jgi:hypothetical protein